MTTTTNTATPDYIVDGVLTDGEAWVALGTATPSSANVTFTSSTGANDWSQYMDLVMICYVRSVGTGTWKDMTMTFNNDTGFSYQNQHLYGNGSSAGAGVANPQYTGLAYIAGAGATANVFSAVIYNIFDINSGKYKYVQTNSAAKGGNPDTIWTETGTWESQAAITEIDLTTPSGFAAGSRFDLFGVLPRMVS
tara:strand:+ start:908 stop:1489 length:582 start_codon:yes stop_codon:yes gene_type:complete